MNDEASGHSTDPSLSPPSPGATLASARHGARLSIAELSQRTKISSEILRAIEEDRFEILPAVRVYIRGFIRAFAGEVGLEPDEITAHYLDAWQRWADARNPD